MSIDIGWAKVDLKKVPHLATTEIPGPKSRELHARATKIMKGLSGQVKLFPVVFESGKGCTLTDVDGNVYLDFSSGIYVTTLGHCHPKVSEAVAKYAKQLMNAHDFTTPIKVKLLEKMTEILPKGMTAVQLYDSGTTAVEAGLRVCRAVSKKHEFLSCFQDFHGKSGHSASLARMNYTNGAGRAPGFYMVPRPEPVPAPVQEGRRLDRHGRLPRLLRRVPRGGDHQPGGGDRARAHPGLGAARCSRPTTSSPSCGSGATSGRSSSSPTRSSPSIGRTGKWLAMEHWNTMPDVFTLGKGFGNGFPVTAMVAKAEFGDAFETISASTSYGGNPMACAAALASIEAIQEEGLLENAKRLEDYFTGRLAKMKASHKIIGDVRCKGCLMGVELVKDRTTKEPFDEAGKLVYQGAFRKGLAWIPAGHILRMSPPIVMDLDVAAKCMDIIDETIGEVEKKLGYAT